MIKRYVLYYILIEFSMMTLWTGLIQQHSASNDTKLDHTKEILKTLL